MTYRPYNIIIQQAQTSGTSAVSYTLENITGQPIPALVPVSTSSTGGMKRINVSNETDALSAIGVTLSSTLNAADGTVIGLGRIPDIGNVFPLNSTIWVSKTGDLTDVVPETDVDGFQAFDFVIRVGKVVKNQTDPTKRDLLVKIQLIGQLA